MKVMNGLDLQSQKVVNLADPSANTDAANHCLRFIKPPYMENKNRISVVQPKDRLKRELKCRVFTCTLKAL